MKTLDPDALYCTVTTTWRPARPGDTPGELVPEHGPTQPVDLLCGPLMWLGTADLAPFIAGAVAGAAPTTTEETR